MGTCMAQDMNCYFVDNFFFDGKCHEEVGCREASRIAPVQKNFALMLGTDGIALR